MKIKTNTVLKELNGKEIKSLDGDFTLGEALSNILVSSKTGGKMKLYVLATKLYKSKEVEVDESDISLIKEMIKASEIYSALILGQCELLLENIK